MIKKSDAAREITYTTYKIQTKGAGNECRKNNKRTHKDSG